VVHVSGTVFYDVTITGICLHCLFSQGTVELSMRPLSRGGGHYVIILVIDATIAGDGTDFSTQGDRAQPPVCGVSC